MVRRRILWLVIVGLMLAGCGGSPPASLSVPLAYPSVTRVEEKALDEGDAILHIYKSVSFSTGDSPEAVLKYYREKMEGEGWKVEEFQPDPSALMFRWESYEQPPATYWCEVVAKAGNGGITSVRVDLRDSAGN